MAKIKAVLTLTVHYEDESGVMTKEDMMTEAKENLDALVSRAAGQGLLSGNSEMVVETFDHEIKVTDKQ